MIYYWKKLSYYIELNFKEVVSMVRSEEIFSGC